jgi:hypothetical protein
MKTSTLIALIAATSLTTATFGEPADAGQLPPPSDQKDVTYTKNIKTIFDKSCTRCHGAEKPKARLRLDSLEAALKGGEDGKVIVPGDSAKSMLVRSVGHIGNKDNWMPPLHNRANIPPLTKDEIGLIRAWIDQGSK